MGVERLIRDLKDADKRLGGTSVPGAGGGFLDGGSLPPVGEARPWPIAVFGLILLLIVGMGAGALWYFEYSPAAAEDGSVASQPPEGPVTAPLMSFALDLINVDRAAHGLAPVALGTNPAAQLHAEDMLEHSYQGHWWVDGRKPYMVYTQTGGTSYVSENVGSRGWTDRAWQEGDCGNWWRRSCIRPKADESITELQYLMMYDDAHANWGHRDNILGEGHRVVNLGIASNGRRLTYVQHFEGGAVIAPVPPALGPGGQLHLELVKQEPGVPIWPVIGIYYDPPPVPRTPTKIDELGGYCIGGGFTDDCGGIEALVRILKPPGAGRSYNDLAPNMVVADIRWEETTNHFAVTASMGTWLEEPGVYTVVIWRDTGDAAGGEILTELSLFVE